MVQTPVLYITFARPEYASQSFAAIKKAQPKKLYFYSNNARVDRPDEIQRNEEVRSFVKHIDWDCEVKTWFRDEYVDVFTSIWGAIDWVFDNEDQAIVIEEDVVTCLPFYEYMDTLLYKYKENKSVWIISGDNATPQYNPEGLSYFPTRFADIYGWATWSDRWHSLDRKMSHWESFRKSRDYHNYFGSFLQRFIQRKRYDMVYKKMDIYNPWDFIFNYNMVRNNAYCLMPYTNLVADIGVSGANHSIALDNPLGKIQIESEHFPFSMGEPQIIKPTSFDGRYYVNYRLMGIIKRKLNKFFRFRG